MSDRKGDAIELLEFVARSPCRIRVLETLYETSPVSRESLKDEVDVVRTTLLRNLQGLVDRGLIRERDRYYEITTAGALTAAGVQNALEQVDTAIGLRPVIERIPSNELEFDLERLADATVVEATTANPYGPVDHHAASLAEMEHARLALPATGAKPLEVSQAPIDAGATFELVVTESVAETLQSESLVADEFETIADYDTVSVSVVDTQIPFFLGIIDDSVQIGVHDDSGLPTALLESSDPVVREWAVDRFETLASRSAPVTDD
ncbi:helix-turn-helix transcriptional regulator [Natrinema halophilum]|uniref:Transcriptional regulator n=1 Tax=Natrinema halophilum TaxID=1699371 RepID=A0A7D5GQR4_9EURY|nr:transcriptional regulator [Natrinema halophilum]QLG47969.1 transcriptional regulator [Natrinema halophilum]